jgi:hypothetical protein
MLEQYKVLLVILERTLKIIVSPTWLAILTNLPGSSVGCKRVAKVMVCLRIVA